MTRHYLDNASTSFPKPDCVWEAFDRQAREVGAPAGRSPCRQACRTDRAIEDTRQALARFFGAAADRVIFTLNATDALNIAIKGFLRPGDHVVTTHMEHNSVRRPLHGLERDRRITVTTVGAADDGMVDPDDIRRALRPETRLVAVVHASNVTGTVLPAREIGRVTREHDIAFLLDAAQSAGSLPISLGEDFVDFLAVPGHKGLLGPPGTGALVISDRVDVEPLREGGTGFRSEEISHPADYPWRLEAGSPNTPGIVALGAAVRYLQERGLDDVRTYLEELMRVLEEGLDTIPGLTWYGPRERERREPVYSVTLEGHSPGELAGILDSSFGVETRPGLHCAPGAHRTIGTFPTGTCRLSPGPLSTMADVEAAVDALGEIARQPLST